MTVAPARRTRLLRLRAIEHRLAAARYATASSAHAEVAAVVSRLANLRAGVGPLTGCVTGLDLQAAASMVDRIDYADASITATLANAEAVLMLRHADRAKARTVEEQLDRFHADALRSEAKAHDVRSAVACQVRPRRRVQP